MTRKLVKLNGKELTLEEKRNRKNYVDKIRIQLIRGQLEGSLEDYVKKYDVEHGFMIKKSLSKPIKKIVKETYPKSDIVPIGNYGDENNSKWFGYETETKKKTTSPLIDLIVDMLLGLGKKKKTEEEVI